MTDPNDVSRRLETAEGAVKELLELLRAQKRKTLELRRELKKLTSTNVGVIASLDAEMKKPSTPERGARIAQIVGVLELANDSAMHFGLDLSFAAMKRHKVKILKGGQA